MLQVSAGQSPPALRTLFNPFDQPAGLRCRAVLDGYMPGVVYTDDPTRPTWAAGWAIVPRGNTGFSDGSRPVNTPSCQMLRPPLSYRMF